MLNSSSRASVAERPLPNEAVLPKPADEAAAPALPASRIALIRAAWQRLFRYDFFISYAWADGRPYAEALVRELAAASYRYRCFIDRREMGGGEAWRASVRKAAAQLRARPEIIESTFDRVKYGFTTVSTYHILWCD